MFPVTARNMAPSLRKTSQFTNIPVHGNLLWIGHYSIRFVLYSWFFENVCSIADIIIAQANRC